MSEVIRLRRRPKQRDDEPGPRPGSVEQEFTIGKTDVLDRWWDEFGSADLRRVAEHFPIDVFRRSSCLDGFDAFLRRTNFSGKRCVEIGTSKGLTAVVLSRYFDEVVTIDIQPDPERKQIASFLGIKNIRHETIASNKQKAGLLEKLDFDAAYSDGDHTNDTESDFALVERCGRVMFHEYWPLQPPVWNLVNGLRKRGTVVSHGTYAIWNARG